MIYSQISTFYSAQDFSAFTYPSTEQPRAVGKRLDYYIPPPTSIRNYLDYPDPSILESMDLPYPFRIKQPISQRMDRLDSNDGLYDKLLNTPSRQRETARKRSNSVGRKL